MGFQVQIFYFFVSSLRVFLSWFFSLSVLSTQVAVLWKCRLTFDKTQAINPRFLQVLWLIDKKVKGIINNGYFKENAHIDCFWLQTRRVDVVILISKSLLLLFHGCRHKRVLPSISCGALEKRGWPANHYCIWLVQPTPILIGIINRC